MSQKLRKFTAERERLKTLAFQEQMSRRGAQRQHNRVYRLSVVAWAILAALPSLFVARPLPYLVGSVAINSIYSRVDFRWQNTAAESQALRNLDSGFAHRYRERPLAEWAAETHGPIDRLLVRAAAAADADEILDYAKELDVPLTPPQADILWRGAAVAKNDPFHYLVTPLKEVLDNEIYAQGILDDQHYAEESGRTIQINRAGTTTTSMVGGERGPTTRAHLETILSQRFRVRMSNWLSDDFKNVVLQLVMARIKPNLEFDKAATDAEQAERRAELLARVQNIKKNDLLVARGDTITYDQIDKLRDEDRAYRQSQGWRFHLTRFAGTLAIFAAVSATLMGYYRAIEKNRPGALRSYLTSATLCLALIYCGYWIIYMAVPGTILPIGLIIGIAAFGMSPRAAVFLVALTSLCGLILFEGRPDLMVGFLSAGIFFAVAAPRCRRRSALLMVSFLAGLVGAVAFIAWSLARGEMQYLVAIATPTWDTALDESRMPLLAALGLQVNWLICGILVLLLIPFIEKFFGVTTRIHLQDLSGYEHPILKRLILEAPGTYHHSSIVSTLAEAGADAIDADGLRARIGGLYHDIGKLRKPEYFTENEAGVSRHANMNPNMSALLIINHVRDGAEMARSLGLPNLVVDMIEQHHGNSLMKFFHHKAQLQAPPGTVVPKDAFLYPGPRPQTPEAGVLMIADAVEAAVRSLDNPSPQHLRELVARLIRERLIDRQFEESGLTMAQLGRVEEVMFRMLASMYHTRVKYPGQERESMTKIRRR